MIPWGTGNNTGERDLGNPFEHPWVRASLYDVYSPFAGPGSPVVRAPRCGRGNVGSVPARGNCSEGFVNASEEIEDTDQITFRASIAVKNSRELMTPDQSETVTEIGLVIQYASSSCNNVK